MRDEYYYANFPTKLYYEKFKSDKDRMLHIAAMGFFVSFVHTGDGYFYISERTLSKLICCSREKAREILSNLENWGYIEKQKAGKNQKDRTIYKLSTYDFDAGEILQEQTQCDKNCQTTKIGQQNRPAETSNINNKSEITNQQNRPAKRPQTNNDLTNNEKTNNEIKTNNEEKFESANVDFERSDKEVGEAQPLETVLDEIDNENICPTNDELDMEINQLIAMYPKKSGNFRRLREKYWNLRLNHGMEFEQVKEAIENYRLEMEDQKLEEKYWKSLETLLDPVELDPFLYKPVIAIDNSGKRFTGEFCIGIGHLRIFVNGRVEGYFIDEKKFARMIEEERLIFCEKEELVHAA